MQGFNTETIAQQTGLPPYMVSKWAYRHDWHSDRTATKQAMVKHADQTIVKSLAEDSIKLKESISQELAKIGSALNGTKTKRNLEHLKKRAQVIESTVSSASKLFGWDSENSARSPVNVNVLTISQQPACSEIVPRGTEMTRCDTSCDSSEHLIVDSSVTTVSPLPQSDKPMLPEPDASLANHTPDQNHNPNQSSQDTQLTSDNALSVAKPSESTTSIHSDQPVLPQPVPKPKSSVRRKRMVKPPKPSQPDSLTGYSAIQVSPTPIP